MKIVIKRLIVRKVGTLTTKKEETIVRDASHICVTADGRVSLSGSIDQNGNVTGSVPIDPSLLSFELFIQG